ncbi:hypothetical protein L484_017224 [Morus notabilis]|uniref:Uncharacterized protein n=1 Tax=Morus notabilis TaxID=981085 RepID=W9R621_9ROSA|nr:hypothetical protein L484_017224 [Morus notabilis]
MSPQMSFFVVVSEELTNYLKTSRPSRLVVMSTGQRSCLADQHIERIGPQFSKQIVLTMQTDL